MTLDTWNPTGSNLKKSSASDTDTAENRAMDRRCTAARLSDYSLPPPPSVDPLPKWNLWNDLDSVKAIIVGLLHADSLLTPEHVAAILRARNPSAYGALTARDVDLVFSWLRSNRDAPDNPYDFMFHKPNRANGAKEISLVLAEMRSSVLLGLLETEAGVAGATGRAHERMEYLKKAGRVVKEWDSDIKMIRKEERQKAKAEKAEGSSNMEEEGVKADEKKDGSAGTE